MDRKTSMCIIPVKCSVFRFINLKVFLIYLFLITIKAGFPIHTIAQVYTDTALISESKALYIENVDTIISVKFNINTEYEQFEVNGDDFYYDIRPNISLSTKLSFSYRYISFGIGLKPKFIPGNNDNDIQGKTRTLSFGFNILTKHWMQELGFGYITGFYLHNTADYPPIPDWTKGDDPYIQFPDLKVAVLRGSTGYKFNENFSLKAISSKTEIQLKSCGSLIPLLSYDYFVIDNKSDDPMQSSSQKSNNLDLVASLGYMYTFVLKSKFYISAGILPGFGLQHTKLLTRYPDEDLITKTNDPLFRLQEKVGMGYNTRRIFTGAEFSMAQSWHEQGNSSISEKATRTFFQIFAGYRFNAPKFLKQEADIVKNIAPVPIQKIIE